MAFRRFWKRSLGSAHQPSYEHRGCSHACGGNDLTTLAWGRGRRHVDGAWARVWPPGSADVLPRAGGVDSGAGGAVAASSTPTVYPREKRAAAPSRALRKRTYRRRGAPCSSRAVVRVAGVRALGLVETSTLRVALPAGRPEDAASVVAWFDEPGLVGADHDLDAVAQAELVQDAGDVALDCRLGDDQLRRDLRV